MTAERAAERLLCGARTRAAGGRPCRLPAGHGTPAVGIEGARCRYHGGRTPMQLRAVETKVAERALAKLGEPIPTDPLVGLQRAVDSASGLHAGLQQLVREAADAESPDSRALVARLAMYSDAIDRLARTAKAAVDAKLTDRQTAVSHAQAAALDAFMRQTLARLELHPEQLAAARRILADVIRDHYLALDGGTNP